MLKCAYLVAGSCILVVASSNPPPARGRSSGCASSGRPPHCCCCSCTRPYCSSELRPPCFGSKPLPLVGQATLAAISRCPGRGSGWWFKFGEELARREGWMRAKLVEGAECCRQCRAARGFVQSCREFCVAQFRWIGNGSPSELPEAATMGNAAEGVCMRGYSVVYSCVEGCRAVEDAVQCGVWQLE